MAKREHGEWSRGRRAAAARAILRRAQASAVLALKCSGKVDLRAERETGESELTEGGSERGQEFKVD